MEGQVPSSVTHAPIPDPPPPVLPLGPSRLGVGGATSTSGSLCDPQVVVDKQLTVPVTFSETLAPTFPGIIREDCHGETEYNSVFKSDWQLLRAFQKRSIRGRDKKHISVASAHSSYLVKVSIDSHGVQTP